MCRGVLRNFPQWTQGGGGGFHAVGGVAGFLMQVSDSGAQSWLLRVRVGDKRREIVLDRFQRLALPERARKLERQRKRSVAELIR